MSVAPELIKPQKPFFKLATVLTFPCAAWLLLGITGSFIRTAGMESIMALFFFAKFLLVPDAVAAFIVVCIALERIEGYPKRTLLLISYLVIIVVFGFLFFPTSYGPGP